MAGQPAVEEAHPAGPPGAIGLGGRGARVQPAHDDRRAGAPEVAHDLPLDLRRRDDARLHDVVASGIGSVRDHVEQAVSEAYTVEARRRDEDRLPRRRERVDPWQQALERAGVGLRGLDAVGGGRGYLGERGRVQELPGSALDPVQGDQPQQREQDDADRAAPLAAGGQAQRHREEHRERNQMELVRPAEQVERAGHHQRGEPERAQTQRPCRGAGQQDDGEVELEQLVRVGRTVVVGRQGQPLEVLDADEAHQVVPHVTRRDDEERREGEHAHPRGRRERPEPATRERHRERSGAAQLGAERDREPAERTGHHGSPAGEQQGSEYQGERARVRPGRARPGHGRGGGHPCQQRRAAGCLPPDERVDEHRHQRVGEHPENAPGEE